MPWIFFFYTVNHFGIFFSKNVANPKVFRCEFLRSKPGVVAFKSDHAERRFPQSHVGGALVAARAALLMSVGVAQIGVS